jgi:hypothetical protein
MRSRRSAGYWPGWPPGRAGCGRQRRGPACLIRRRGAGSAGSPPAALAVELGGEPVRPAAGASRFVLEAVTAAFGAAAGLPGWLEVGAWRFASAVTGGRLIAANTISPYLIVGRRRFMPPIPPLLA